MQSCVKEAMQLAEISGVHAMHDATEGGFVAALNELAEASKVGFRVDWEKIPVCKEMLVLQDYFKLTDEQVAGDVFNRHDFGCCRSSSARKSKSSIKQEWAFRMLFGTIHGK